MKTFNVYCDESAHLPNDGQDVMAMGAISCPMHRARKLSDEVRQIKDRHGMQRNIEIKWTKISPGKVGFYLDLVDFFIECSDLQFHALVVPEKRDLDLNGFGHFSPECYCKMYQRLLFPIVTHRGQFRIYLDIRDTKGGETTQSLQEILCRQASDSGRNHIDFVQIVRSEEVILLQLADLLIGAVRQAYRGELGSIAKKAVSERLREHSGVSLTRPTQENSGKLNISFWNVPEQEQRP